jgi:hypothetical protein
MTRHRRSELISLAAVRNQWARAPWWLKPVLPLGWALWWLATYLAGIVIIGWLLGITLLIAFAFVYVPFFRPTPMMRRIAA